MYRVHDVMRSVGISLPVLTQVESWTEASLQLFSRHQPSRDHAHHPSKDPAPIQEQQTMLMLNTATDACLSEVGERLAGENGGSLSSPLDYLSSQHVNIYICELWLFV